MRKLQDNTQNQDIKTIINFFKSRNTYYEMESNSNKIMKIQYDDSKLTDPEKTEISLQISRNNPNLS